MYICHNLVLREYDCIANVLQLELSCFSEHDFVVMQYILHKVSGYCVRSVGIIISYLSVLVIDNVKHSIV